MFSAHGKFLDVLTFDEFTTLWKNIFDELIQRARRLGLPHSLAEDVVQDTAIEAIQRILKNKGFNDAGHFTKWAYVTLRFRCLDYLATNRWGLPIGDVAQAATGEYSGDSQQVSEILREIIAKLPDRQREVVERIAANESTESIASAMDISEATVRSLKRLAKEKIQSELAVFEKDK